MTEIEQIDYEEDGYVRDENGNLIPDYEMTIKLFDDGDIVSGTVVRIDRDEILLDIGYKSEGVIPIKELSIRKSVDPNEIVSVGDAIDALVMQKEDKDGRLILSKKRAEFEQAWDRVEKLNKDHQAVEGTVIEVVKGGLILDIGLRGFLPASLVDVRRVKDLRQYIGQKLSCLIIEIDRHRNNVVLSRRAVLDEERRGGAGGWIGVVGMVAEEAVARDGVELAGVLPPGAVRLHGDLVVDEKHGRRTGDFQYKNGYPHTKAYQGKTRGIFILFN